MLRYKGYVGNAVYDNKEKRFHGRALGIRQATITFQAKTKNEVRAAFIDAVDNYLDWCAEKGAVPEVSNVVCQRLILPPELYQQLATAAAMQGIEPLKYITEVLSAEEIEAYSQLHDLKSGA